MKAIKVGGYTLVGFPEEIGVKGNCFTVILENGDERNVANIGLESLRATKVQFPIEGELREREQGRRGWQGNAALFWVTDARVPPEAYRSGLCSCMGGRL